MAAVINASSSANNSEAPAAGQASIADTPIHRTPTILQLEAVECGAAALAMILAYYGRYVPLEALRLACGVSRDGSKASNVLRAARRYGLVCKGYRKEPADLPGMKLPLIVFWNFNHFLVVEGIRAGRVWLNDPARGRRSVSQAEFDQSFTGVVLSFEPGPEFTPGGTPPSVIRALRHYADGMQTTLSLLVLLGLLLVIPGLIFPLLSSRFIDEVLTRHVSGLALPLMFGLAATALLRAGLGWLQMRLLSRAHAELALRSAGRFFRHALHLPAEFYTQRSAGEIAARVGINDRVAEIVTADLSQMALNIMTALFFLIAMLVYNPLMGLFALAGVVFETLVWRMISLRSVELAQQLAVQGGKLSGTAMNGLSNIEAIKASGQEGGLYARWIGLQIHYVNTAVRAEWMALTIGHAPALFGLMVQLAILGLGSVRIIDGTMTIGGLVAFQTLAASFAAPANTLLGLTQKIQTLQGDLARLDDVLNYPAEHLGDTPANNAATAELPPVQGKLELRNVSFGYNRNEGPLINDFSLMLEPGRRIALVGASGCGKSTIARLTVGLYQPWQGEILFDDMPQTEHLGGPAARTRFAASVALIDQDIALFEGTVRDNLSMWDASVNEADLVAAARDACIHDSIMERPGAYDALVEEGGRNFSGGQRQRLEIARALVRNPRILVLDEATSALDPVTEQQVELNLRRRGCTSIVVAHRLSTVRDADEIVVLERGQVIERGTHAQLVTIPGGQYSRLVANGDDSEVADEQPAESLEHVHE